MFSLSAWKKATIACLFGAFVIATTHAQSFKVLANLNGENGAGPVSVIQGRDGNLYGTARGGGRDCYFHDNNTGCGTVFKLALDGTLTVVCEFGTQNCESANPSEGLVLAGDSNFYGLTDCPGGDCGAVFKMSPKGDLVVLHEFCTQRGCPDGQDPGRLLQGSDGSFYGTTLIYGKYSGGTVFKITSAGHFATLHNFCRDPERNCSDGEAPRVLIQGADGNLYGATDAAFFKIDRTGAFSLLQPVYGAPEGSLAQAADGSIYGTTFRGGAYDSGTVFKITPTGEFTTLYSFCAKAKCVDGKWPRGGLIQATDGNLYGTTQSGGSNACSDGCGTVFRLTPDGKLTILHVFQRTDGANPSHELFQATNGILYGTTSKSSDDFACGVFGSGCGEIFSFDMGLLPVVAFVRDSGKVGQTGGILGQGFTGTTSVMLNGTPASFKIVSDTYLTATVPPGATSGYVTVTTPSGVLKSNKPFQVIP